MDEPDRQLDELQDLWDLCKAQDDQKKSLIDSLFSHVKTLNEQLDEVKRDLKYQKQFSDFCRAKDEEAQKEISYLKHEKDRHAFAVVLIDGDCMPFKDDLVKDGVLGGRQAAHNLKQAIKELGAEAKLSHLQVVVRVYANFQGLAKAYKNTEILPDPTVLHEFVRGFNMADALFDFVDAGNGKECSDEKVKGMFRLSLEDVHCQQIFFGGSADNGYARLLGQYVQDRAVCGRVTLLEGPPFAYELADIKDRFRVAPLHDVFRRDKLPTLKRRVSFHITPPSTPAPDYAKIAASKPASPTLQSEAIVIPKTFSVAGPSSSSSSSPPSSVPPALRTAIVPYRGEGSVVKRNKLGQRVDPPLDYSQFDFQTLKLRRLCNNFHLIGECYYKNCVHEHGERLPASKQQALRAVARLSVCQWGLDCSDPKCTSGHRCTRAECVPATCRFPASMHNVDTKIV